MKSERYGLHKIGILGLILFVGVLGSVFIKQGKPKTPEVQAVTLVEPDPQCINQKEGAPCIDECYSPCKPGMNCITVCTTGYGSCRAGRCNISGNYPSPTVSSNNACVGKNDGTGCTLSDCYAPPCEPNQACPQVCQRISGTCQQEKCKLSGTFPPGCTLEQVQCVREPCEPVLICKSPIRTTKTTVRPTATPRPIVTCTSRPKGDLNDDCTVNIFDLNILLSNFGKPGL